MNVLANKRLDLDIINIISDLSTELQIKAFLVGGYVRDLILDSFLGFYFWKKSLLLAHQS